MVYSVRYSMVLHEHILVFIAEPVLGQAASYCVGQGPQRSLMKGLGRPPRKFSNNLWESPFLFFIHENLENHLDGALRRMHRHVRTHREFLWALKTHNHFINGSVLNCLPLKSLKYWIHLKILHPLQADLNASFHHFLFATKMFHQLEADSQMKRRVSQFIVSLKLNLYNKLENHTSRSCWRHTATALVCSQDVRMWKIRNVGCYRNTQKYQVGGWPELWLVRSRGSAATAEVGFGGEEKILLQLEVVGVYIVR